MTIEHGEELVFIKSNLGLYDDGTEDTDDEEEREAMIKPPKDGRTRSTR
jgi:hypothetical protein